MFRSHYTPTFDEFKQTLIINYRITKPQLKFLLFNAANWKNCDEIKIALKGNKIYLKILSQISPPNDVLIQIISVTMRASFLNIAKLAIHKTKINRSQILGDITKLSNNRTTN